MSCPLIVFGISTRSRVSPQRGFETQSVLNCLYLGTLSGGVCAHSATVSLGLSGWVTNGSQHELSSLQLWPRGAWGALRGPLSWSLTSSSNEGSCQPPLQCHSPCSSPEKAANGRKIPRCAQAVQPGSKRRNKRAAAGPVSILTLQSESQSKGFLLPNWLRNDAHFFISASFLLYLAVMQ